MKTDVGAIVDGRLTVCVTKFDLMRQKGASSEEVKEKAIESIEQTTQLKISKNLVIPVCGDWAMSGSKVAKSLESGHYQDWLDNVLKALEVSHSLLDVPCGQGEDIQDALRSNFDPSALVQMLESICGFDELKKRYKASEKHALLCNCLLYVCVMVQN